MMTAEPVNLMAGSAGMQIDFRDNIKSDIADNNAAANPKTDGFRVAADSLNTALAADNSGVISMAIADCERIDTNLITDARLSIDLGQLDLPEAIDSAGQNILKSGI